MTDVETLSERLRTVERAVTEGEHTFPEVDDIAELTERVETLERRVEELDERTEELEGATQALRGYVGNVRSVNERVQQRADTALAATERLERRLEAVETEGSDRQRDADPSSETAGQPPAEQSTTRTEPVADDDATRPAGGPAGPTDTSEFEFGSERRTDDADESADPGVLERMRSLL